MNVVYAIRRICEDFQDNFAAFHRYYAACSSFNSRQQSPGSTHLFKGAANAIVDGL